jgi:hypothetical protein
VQCDGDAAYKTIANAARDEAITLAFCWAHLRRRFFDIAQGGPAPIASEALERIAAQLAPPDNGAFRSDSLCSGCMQVSFRTSVGASAKFPSSCGHLPIRISDPIPCPAPAWFFLWWRARGNNQKGLRRREILEPWDLDESHPCECALVDLIPAMLPENNFSLSIARGIRHAVYRESHPPKRPRVHARC